MHAILPKSWARIFRALKNSILVPPDSFSLLLIVSLRIFISDSPTSKEVAISNFIDCLLVDVSAFGNVAPDPRNQLHSPGSTGYPGRRRSAESPGSAGHAELPTSQGKVWGILREGLNSPSADKRAKATRALSLLPGNVDAETATIVGPGKSARVLRREREIFTLDTMACDDIAYDDRMARCRS